MTEALKAAGLFDTALIIFTTDNGGPAASDGNMASNYPLRGRKATLWEGGLRGVGFVAGLGVAKSFVGGTMPQLMHAVDWLPTLCSIAVRGIGAAAAADSRNWTMLLDPTEPPRQLGDGMDLSRVLAEADVTEVRTELVHESHPASDPHGGHGSALRVGRYKLLVRVGQVGWVTEGLVNPAALDYTVSCPPPPGSPPNSTSGVRLYDILSDPCEQKDLSDSLPAMVAALQARLAQYAATSVPASFCQQEGEAACGAASSDPKLFNYTWTPWCPGASASTGNRTGNSGGGGAAAAAVAAAAVLPLTAAAAAVLDTRTAAAAVLDTMADVNRYFQAGTPVANADWTGGVYMAGNLAHFRVSENASLLAYAVNWGQSHKWQMAGYRGCLGAQGCPDNIAAGQGYAEIYALKREPVMVAGLIAAIDAAVASPCMVRNNSSQRKDSDRCWWWVDALLMALPTYARVGALAASPDAAGRIWDAARAQYNITAFGVNASGSPAFRLWSPGDSLFYRDDSYLGSRAPNGHGVFWSRGNGWAFAAMARALEALPASRTADRAEYSSKLVTMAARLIKLQGGDGCWRSSLEDPEQFPSIETSGTSLFVFGLAWGVNNGVLGRGTGYDTAATRGWACLTRPSPVGAVMPDGRLGWCQPGGASPNGNFNASTTSDFCVGSFLLAGSEVAKLAAAREHAE